MVQNKKGWQRKFIKSIFDSSDENEKNFSRIIMKNPNLINRKNKYLPNYLFKYYSPSSNNIIDLQNQKLWLADPKSFNDPFDSNIGYDKEEFEKRALIKFIDEKGFVDELKKMTGFTLNDKNRIENSYTSENYNYKADQENFFDVKCEVLDSKSEKLQDDATQHINELLKDLDNKIKYIKNINIRVACFSRLDKYDEFYKKIAMWSHYADNHKGFCVEYDLSSLHAINHLQLANYEFYEHKKAYIDERNKFIIKAGLFPIEYTSRRVNIPVTKLNKVKLNSSGDLKYNTNIDELIYKTLVVKSSNWSYEKEWRIIIDGAICEYFDNKIPFPFAKKIYIGCRASDELIDILVSIGEEIGAEVELLKMDGKKFTLESEGLWRYEYKEEKKKFNNPYDF